MDQIVIQNATYQIQREFSGTKPVSELIGTRVCRQTSTILPLTKAEAIPYNGHGDCTVVRRYNGQ